MTLVFCDRTNAIDERKRRDKVWERVLFFQMVVVDDVPVIELTFKVAGEF